LVSLTPERIALLQSLKGWSWKPIADQWNDAFQRLKVYATENDHATPPRDFKTKDDYKLGNWVANQRRNKKIHSPERIALLESLKNWSWKRITDKWNDAFERLKVYATENDHTTPRRDFKTKDGFALGVWVSVQRRNKEFLSPERIAFLKSLKNWSWKPYTDQWNEGFERLKAYIKETGAATPPQRFSTDGFALGQWVNTQRKNKDALTPERKRLLESLAGWSFDPLTDQWNQGFAQLKMYVKKYGKSRPPTDFRTNEGYKLGQWVRVKRGNKDTLTPERIALLESLPGWKWSASK